MIVERVVTFVEAMMKRHLQRGTHIATRMTLANKLKVTRLISSPGVIKKKMGLGIFREKASLQTCDNVIESDDGDKR